MNIFHYSIHAFVFAAALLLGTTAVIASRFVVATVASLTKPAAALESPVPEAYPEPIVAMEDLRNEHPAPEDFDPSGSYSLDTEKVPAAFADIEFLEITTREYEEENGTYTNRPIVPTGLLQTKKSFAFARIFIGDREISFETNTVGGISYQFVGNFPLANEMIDCESCEYPADLNGKLRKLKYGKVIAELDAKLYAHGC